MAKTIDPTDDLTDDPTNLGTTSLGTTSLGTTSLGKDESKPVAQDATRLGGYAYQIIRQQSQAVFELRSPVLGDTDIENLHQMRIGTRRLRAALLLFTDVVKADASKAIRSDTDSSDTGSSDTGSSSSLETLTEPVKQLTKALGKVRDVDVMQQWLADAIATPSKKEKKTIKALLRKLKKRRKKQFSKLEKALTSKVYKKLKKRCKQWLKQPSFGPAAQQPAASSAVETLIAPLVELLQHPGWNVATSQKGQQRVPTKNITLNQLNQQLETDSDSLHDLRKQIKQARYQTEFFRGIYGINYAAQVRELRSLQKVLGQLQDQLVIADFLTDELGKEWANRLPTIDQAFQSSRLALWHQWQPLQAKYLKLQAAADTAVA
ncbi:MAG: CHAD domain-containing protein [Phormidesmis sp.]